MNDEHAVVILFPVAIAPFHLNQIVIFTILPVRPSGCSPTPIVERAVTFAAETARETLIAWL